jgi:hypothetical protein
MKTLIVILAALVFVALLVCAQLFIFQGLETLRR